MPRKPILSAIAWTFVVAGCGASATQQTAPETPTDAAAPPLDASVPVDAALPDAPTTDDGHPFTRVDTVIDDAWHFHKGDVAGSEASAFDDSAWDAIQLPHTWNAIDGETGGNTYYRGVGVYRRHLTVDSSFANRRFFLRFDGANIVTDVFVNGQSVGQHKGGFAAFDYDVTPLVTVGGDNVIAVKVNNASDPSVPPLTADFTFFGGLYRDAHFIVTDGLHVDLLDYGSPGVYLTPSNITDASADFSARVRVRNDTPKDADAIVHLTVLDAQNTKVASVDVPAKVATGATSDVEAKTTIPTPHLWQGRSDAYLYHARIEIEGTGSIVDQVVQPFGIRSYVVDKNTGFVLNGKALGLHGVNRHQDRLDMGWAITAKQHDEDFALIQEMGATAIRLAHYQHANHFYDLADAGGMVVWAEIPLVNSITATQAFTDNAKQQLIELIRQNYNHPSICFWSISNEISLVGGPDYNALLDELAKTVHAEDPTRLAALATTGSGTDYPHADVAGFNRYYGWYYGALTDFAGWADGLHAQSPDMRVAVSEYGAGSSITMHSETPKALDHTEEYQSLFHESHWAQMKTRPFLWGTFVWNMFDFASATRAEGDTTGRNDKGLVTYDRKTKKDAFYFYKANWTTDPFVYITSRRFTNRTAATITIKAYAVADSVEVTLNGTSLGVKTGTNGTFTWTGVKLATGSNAVHAKATKGNQTVTDDVTWTH